MASIFKPFADNSQSVNIDELTFENQGQQVNLYGNTTFTIDKESLATAKALHELLGEIISYLEAQGAIKIDKSKTIEDQQNNIAEVSNPFI